MSFFSSVSSGVKGYFNKNAEERRIMEEVSKEAERYRLVNFREQLGIDSKKVAEAQAKTLAAEKSGLQKLRAVSRARHLSQPGPEPGTWNAKLRNRLNENKARTQARLERTDELRGVAKQEQDKKMAERVALRETRLATRPTPLGLRKSTWKM